MFPSSQVLSKDQPQLIVRNGRTTPITAVACSPDGKKLIAGLDDGTAVLWDLRQGKPLHVFKRHKKHISAVQFAPDGKTILTASWDQSLVIWDVEQGKPLHVFKGIKRGALAAAYAPDGKSIVVTTGAGEAIQFSAVTGKRTRTIDKMTCSVYSVVVAPDGKAILTASEHSPVTLWDIKSGKALRTFGDLYVNLGAELSPDGKAVLTFGQGITSLWETRSGKRLRELNDGSERGAVARFHPGGQAIFLFDHVGKGQLIDLKRGRILQKFEMGWPHCAQFTPEGKSIVTGSREGTVQLWDVRTGRVIVRLIHLNQGRDWLVVTGEGYYTGSSRARKRVSWKIDGRIQRPEQTVKRFHRPNRVAKTLQGLADR